MTSIPDETKQYIANVSTEVISRLASIAETAARRLLEPRYGSSALVYPNQTNAPAASENLAKIATAVAASNEHLTREPAIARVVVYDARRQERTYYICRTLPVSGIENLASYRSPVGRLASLAIGESIVVPNGEELEVAARAFVHPNKNDIGWDSTQTVVETASFGPVTVISLWEFLNSFGAFDHDEDILMQIAAEERLSDSFIVGLRRSVITKMTLRDQPILNSIQDGIFRLPINRQLILLGPPGTGKTTTLIRRLGQKLDQAYLTDDEKKLIATAKTASRLRHEESWLMFTPTKLLRLYLKEAFAREQVPASDLRIQTWDDFRWNVSKNLFGILRGTTGTGLFVLRPEVSYLLEDIQANSFNWYEDFFEWQHAEFMCEMNNAATALASSHMPGASGLAARLQEVLQGRGWNVLKALTFEARKAQNLVSAIKGSSDDKINTTLREQLRKNPKFIEELTQFLHAQGQDSETITDDVEDSDGSDDDDDIEIGRTEKTKAINRYIRALRSQARGLAEKRSLENSRPTAKLIDWIGDRRLNDSELTDIGKALLIQSHAKRFTNPIHRYITSVHRRYGKFRKLRKSQGRWFADSPIEPRHIHPLELDIIILAILRVSNQLLSDLQIVNQLDDPLWGSLEPVFSLYRNQVLVDEATDFSPVQLACMAALAHPATRSFFACGDFNQRLTTWGTRSTEELKHIAQGLEFREVNIAYRQTVQLNNLARHIIVALGGINPIVELPMNVNNDGVAPALIEGANDLESVTRWLADRLQEIERFVGRMPSTAIFVNSEDNVIPLAELLNNALTENNLRVVACSQGQVVAQDSDIRVFDIQHIKGLEFEAVFFVGVDCLAEKYPTLFNKYLYVGATRAATYLGLTCNQRLPSAIESLRPQFTLHWSAPANTTSGAI